MGVAISPHPLFGLVHTIDIVRLAEGTDDAGGPAISHEVPVYEDLCARITLFGGRYPDPDRQHDHGVDGKSLWTVITPPICEVAPSDRVLVPHGNNPANLLSELGSDCTEIVDPMRFRIIKIFHRYDECGRFHHTSLQIELSCGPGPADETANPIWA